MEIDCKLNSFEMETYVSFNRAEPNAYITTRDDVVRRKLQKLVEKFPDAYSIIREDAITLEVLCANKKLIRFGSPRVVSEEQKEIARARMLEWHSNNKGEDDSDGEDDTFNVE